MNTIMMQIFLADVCGRMQLIQFSTQQYNNSVLTYRTLQSRRSLRLTDFECTLDKKVCIEDGKEHLTEELIFSLLLKRLSDSS